ncbi:MAG: hypothetical protein L3K06_02805 [Thermoplasmata archaeon]|nr:hypothetical protein [Thermoplasmata archaeon]
MLAEDAYNVLAATAVVVIAIFLAMSAYLLWKLPKSGGLLDAMVKVVLVPGKLRRWFIVLSAEGSLFVLSGLTDELTEVGWIGEWGARLLSPILFIGAMTCLMVLLYIGLRPSDLTATERDEARASVPRVFDSLALAPFPDGPSAEESRGR